MEEEKGKTHDMSNQLEELMKIIASQDGELKQKNSNEIYLNHTINS